MSSPQYKSSQSKGHVRQRIQHWCTMFTTTSVQQTLNEMVCYMQSTKHGNYGHIKCLLDFFNMRVYHPGQFSMQACLGKQALVLFWVSSQALGYFFIWQMATFSYEQLGIFSYDQLSTFSYDNWLHMTNGYFLIWTTVYFLIWPTVYFLIWRERTKDPLLAQGLESINQGVCSPCGTQTLLSTDCKSKSVVQQWYKTLLQCE